LSGEQGALVIQDLDRQEFYLRKGLIPNPGSWISPDEISSEARIWKGDNSYNYPGVPGNYPQFYIQVRQALVTGGTLPVSPQFALRVSEIIDQARIMSVRD
jgi:hypothetical protein